MNIFVMLSFSFSRDYVLLRLIQGCFKPYSGVILFEGSIIKQLWNYFSKKNTLTSIKFIKSSSPSLNKESLIVKLLTPALDGNRLFLLLINSLFWLKNYLLLRHVVIMSSGGNPILILINSSSSFSSYAGNIGLPVESSHRMHPKDHMSTALSYGRPITISGHL